MSVITRNIGKVSIVPKGIWNNNNTYTRLDLVSYNGSSYIAKQDVPINININNENYWKLIAKKGDTGASINDIRKTGTSVDGLTDTYTVYLTNGETTTFQVKNGIGITSITGPSTSGQIDTYTINFEDGKSTTFTIKNAKSIESITEVDVTYTPGEKDKYRINYNDGTYFDFEIQNGEDGQGLVSTVDNIRAINQDVSLLIFGDEAPTTNTVGKFKQRYYDRINKILYICTNIDTTDAQPIYTWQSTGTPVDNELSTTSQNPVQNNVLTNKINELNTKKYEKPSDGIPKADLASTVQTSLDKADSALQSVPSTYRTAAAQDVIDASFSAFKRTNNNLVCFGDSWTVGTGIANADRPTKRFTAIVANKLDCTEFNFGVGASGFIRSGNLFSTQINTADSQMTTEQKNNTGVVLIVGGVNDYRQQLSTSTQAQFVEGVVSTANLAHTVFPNALIVLGIGNTNLSYFPATARKWYLAAISACERQLNFPSIVIKNLYNVISANTALYTSDNLHPNEDGHGYFGGYIANAILGGGQTVFSAVGTVSLSSGVALDGTEGPTELTLWRVNDEIVVGAARFTFSPAITASTIIGTIPAKITPASNAYFPFYYANQFAGNIAITTSGNIYLIPATGVSSITSGFNQQIRYMFGKPTNTDES